MGLLGLFGKKAKRELATAQQNIIGLMAKWDWDTVSEYELDQREKVLDTVTEQMVAAERVYNKEQGEYDAMLKQYNEKMADAESLNNQITDANRAKFEAHLGKLLTEIEDMKPELDREEQEALDAKEHFELLKETVETAATKLVQTRKIMQDKKRTLDRLTIEEERQKQREQDKMVLAGIREQVDSMGTITSAIDKEIEKKQDAIAASKVKTDAIGRNIKSGSSETTDPEILAALGKAKTEQPPMSAADRLAALRRK